MKYIRTKDGFVYNLESNKISSVEYIDENTAVNEYGVEGAFYSIYFYDEEDGHYLERDNKGGHSCDFVNEKDIIITADSIYEICDIFFAYEESQNNGQPIVVDEKLLFSLIPIMIMGLNSKLNCWLKGAIFTDKGLTYICELKKEGKMELI